MKRFMLIVPAAFALLAVATGARADVAFLVQDDAYVQSSGTGSGAANMVLVKRDTGAVSSSHRKGYISYDLTDYQAALAARSGRGVNTQLDLPFVFTSVGGTSASTVWDFEVYGLTDESVDSWDESTIDYSNAPANDASDGNTVDGTKTTSIATFTGMGTMSGVTQSISGAALDSFLNSDTDNVGTFIIVRNTAAGDNYAHGFQSKEATTGGGAKIKLIETGNRLDANSEFETFGGSFDKTGWSSTGAALEHDGLIAGSQKAVFMDSSQSGNLADSPNAQSENFSVDMYFATADGGGGGGDRGFNVNYEFFGSGQINLRVNGVGQIQVFNDQGLGGTTGWKTLSDLSGLIAFSEDNNADLDFTDVGDVLNVFRIKLVMYGSGTANPYYDVYLSAANSTTFAAVATGLQFFQNDVPDASVAAGLELLEFDIANGNGNYAVDSVYIAIPEPAGFAMLSLGALALLHRRR
ncbi:PEP-CTERM sorting domain-containing protein [Planctomycetales bacterium ZRK34]|nr:PEP-CTERM sorting domain-containing protein [Planctomycetales bacterium ZRK34]